MTPNSALLLPLGTTVGSRRAVGLLGECVHSQVYLTIDKLGRLGAVKVFRPGPLEVSAIRKYVQRASSASQVTGGATLQFLSEKSPVCVSVPLVPGQSLDSLLEGGKKFHWLFAEQLMIETARQLETTHGSQIVHGGLKPSNIFVSLTNRGVDRVRIVDYGSFYLTEDSEVTIADNLLQYVAPEQDVAATGDMYALGAIIFRVLTGYAPPLPTRGTFEKVRTALSEVAFEGPSLCEKVQKLLAQDPSSRPTAAALVEQADERGDEPTTVVQSRKKRPYKRVKREAESQPATEFLPLPRESSVKTQPGEPTQIVVSPGTSDSGWELDPPKEQRGQMLPGGPERRLLLLNVSLVVVVVLILVALAITS